MAQPAETAGGHPAQPGELNHDVLVALLEQQFRRLRLDVDKENVVPAAAMAPAAKPRSRGGRRAPPPWSTARRRKERFRRRAALVLQTVDADTATPDIKLPSYAEVLAQPVPSEDDPSTGVGSPIGSDGGGRNGGWEHRANAVATERSPPRSGIHGRRFSESAVTRLGVRWAPWDIPLPRRMQTFAVWFHTYSIFYSTAIFFFSCANPLLWIFLFPYVCYLLWHNNAPSDGKLSWRSERFRSWFVWRLFADYFPAELHKTADLPADRK